MTTIQTKSLDIPIYISSPIELNSSLSQFSSMNNTVIKLNLSHANNRFPNQTIGILVFASSLYQIQNN
jgi:hypothetical protein